MNCSKRLGSRKQEDPPHVIADLLLGPVGVERVLVRFAQAARRPVQARGLPQALGRAHRAVPFELLGEGRSTRLR